MRTELGTTSWVDLDPNWLPAAEADDLLTSLLADLSWAARPIVVFGKEVMQPRLIAWCGEVPYKYSGQVLEPTPFTPALGALNQRVSELLDVPFNHVLLNRYRDGKDNMGMHADDERQLGRDPVIAALSLGVTRKFALRHKRKRRWRKHLQLTHGSLLVMGGRCQHEWHHGVPKQMRVTEERINVTFRWLKEGVEPAR
ncbi:MAG: alpha-ketoglutarate-dependent dioxygenase AlkB [Deltaproteobacteria bacterium]